MGSKQPVVRLENVHWKRQARSIIENVNWQINAGEHWAVLGLNGSGKTSLLQFIAGYHWPTKGTVHVLGHQLGRVDIRELRKSIGFLSTNVEERFKRRHHDSAMEVVLSGCEATVGIFHEVSPKEQERASELLQRFDLEHVADQPFGLLSQGETRKALLARAWMTGPRILILDEPCSGLDIRSREQLLQGIQTMTEAEDAPTIIYVTHHIEEVMPGISHALLMKEGHVIGRGLKSEMITNAMIRETMRVPVHIEWQDERPWMHVRSETHSKRCWKSTS